MSSFWITFVCGLICSPLGIAVIALVYGIWRECVTNRSECCWPFEDGTKPMEHRCWDAAPLPRAKARQGTHARWGWP